MEANNMAAVREAARVALDKVNEIYAILSKPCVVVEEARQACREARGVLIPVLALPPRQCDVGTPEEQYARHEAYCEKQDMYCLSDDIFNCRTCFTKWAQTPYEAKEAE